MWISMSRMHQLIPILSIRHFHRMLNTGEKVLWQDVHHMRVDPKLSVGIGSLIYLIGSRVHTFSKAVMHSPS